MDHFLSQLVVPSTYPARSDFEPAQFYTDDYAVARAFSSSRGVISVHSWDAEHGSLTVKRLEGDDWEKTVKYHVSSTNSTLPWTPPILWEEDFWAGAMSGGHVPNLPLRLSLSNEHVPTRRENQGRH